MPRPGYGHPAMATSGAEWVAAVSGGAAAVAAAGAALAAARAASKAGVTTAASLELVKVEQERLTAERLLREVAELSAELQVDPTASWAVVVVNQGPSAAGRVELFVYEPGHPAVFYQAVRPGYVARLAQNRMAPNEHLEVLTSMPAGAAIAVGVSLTWLDSRGKQTKNDILVHRP